MCGIAGTTAATQEQLDAFCAGLAHRGPDAGGVWIENGVGLSHTRLAIIDLSAAANQPMTSVCGRWVLTFNGEIYNFRELRAELEAKGERFRTDSDTEVLLTLLARDGEAALAKLHGMFAFALWDREKREFLVARDRVGIKPLVYAPLGNGGIAFASEIEALRAHPGIDDTIDPASISAYLACLYIPAPATARRGIRKLPPGHFLRWRDGKTTISRYWQAIFHGNRAPSLDDAVDEVLPLLRDSVAGHMISDVPVGCFLSGGIDSSVIAALMAEEARRRGAPPIRTFTLTFDEAAYDEREAAREVACHIGSTHVELPASPHTAITRFPDMLRSFGEPFGNPTALLIDDLSRKAREHVTVALVGDGGDEVFAGYPRYQGGLLAQHYRRLPGWIRRHILKPAATLIPEDVGGRHGARRIREFLSHGDEPADRMYASWVEYFSPSERAALLGDTHQPEQPIARVYAETGIDDPLDAMQTSDLRTFLPGNILAYGDAMSMAHGLELRLPLLDHRVIEHVAKFAPGLRVSKGLKTVLRGVADRLLPSSVTRRPKRGLNPPMGLWVNRDLGPLIDERLAPARLEAIGIRPAPVQRLLIEHRGGQRDHALKIWALFVLEAWATA